MINYFKALNIILNNSQKKNLFLNKKTVNILKSINKINTTNIFSNKNIPYFKSSAMDGYAIKTKKLDLSKPIRIIKSVKTRDLIEYKNIELNDSIEITTGSRIPSVFNSIIKIEDTEKKKTKYIYKKKYNRK